VHDERHTVDGGRPRPGGRYAAVVVDDQSDEAPEQDDGDQRAPSRPVRTCYGATPSRLEHRVESTPASNVGI
jgi:hypothetical protein